MTHEEIAQKRATLRKKSIENNRRRQILLGNEKSRHRDAVNAEADRHMAEVRKIEAEAQTRADEVQAMRDELALEEARLYDTEETKHYDDNDRAV